MTFSCEGKTIKKEHAGTEWVARIRGITAKELGNDFTLTVSDGTNTGSVTYSPMTYCYNVISRGTNDENLPTVVKALYWYWQNAAAYFAD